MTNQPRPDQTALLDIVRGGKTYRLTSSPTASGSRVFTLTKTARGGVSRTDTPLRLGRDYGRHYIGAHIGLADQCVCDRSAYAQTTMMQRFGLLVWPDRVPLVPADLATPKEASDASWHAFDHLDKLNPDDVGAVKEEHDKVAYLRFAEPARARFVEWQVDLEKRQRDMTPAMASHVDKYGSLVPPLALINHLADFGKGPVSLAALERAIRFSIYLESHARRAYGAGQEVGVIAAKAILGHFTPIPGSPKVR